MKKWWDEKYFKICLYVVVAFGLIYILKLAVDSVAYVLVNVNETGAFFDNFFSKLSSVFAPLIIALILAYLLDPFVDFLERGYFVFYERYLKDTFRRPNWIKKHKKKKEKPQKRVAGVTLAYLSVFLFFFILFWSFFGKLISSNNDDFVRNVVNNIMGVFNSFSEAVNTIQINLLDWGVSEYFSGFITEFLQSITLTASGFIRGLSETISSAGTGILNFLLGIILSAYILLDKDVILKTSSSVAHSYLPTKIYNTFRNIIGDINAVFSGYIRGQLADASIMACLISVWLTVVGVQFSVFIGILSGIANLIPYFGAIIAFFLTIIAALLSGDPMQAVYAGIGILVLQQIDGMFIAPRVVGKSVELGPALVLISLTVGGSLFGIVGMVIAVPTCAIIKLFLTRYYSRRMERLRMLEEEEKENPAESI